MQEVESQPSFAKVLAEHRELRDQLGELLEYLEKPRPELGSSGVDRWAGSLAERLLHLHRKLGRHFREEEASGVLDDLEERFPPAKRAVDALRADHDRILADFRAVIHATMCYTEGRSGESQNLRRWTRSIVEHIQLHESEETGLMQRLINQDLGVGD